MASMNLYDFLEMTFNYRLMYRYKYYINGETLNIKFLRYASPVKCYDIDMVIYPDNFFMNTLKLFKIFNTKDPYSILSKILNDYTSRYIYTEKSNCLFSVLELKSRMDNNKFKMANNKKIRELAMFKMKPDQYWNAIFMAKKNSTTMMKLSPNSSEIQIIKNQFKTNSYIKTPLMKHTNINTMSEEMYKVDIHIKKLYEFTTKIFTKSRSFDETNLPSLTTDYRSSINAFMTETLSYKKMSYWCRSRHNIFAEVAIKEMGWDMPTKLDFSPAQVFHYYGVDFFKTPDYIVDMGRHYLMLDFAVTSVSTSYVRKKKINKYKDLASGLSKHLNKEVVIDAVVWNINDRNDFSLPNDMRLIRSTMIDSIDLEFLYRMHINISMMENYDKYRTMAEEEDDEEVENLEFRLEEYNKMLQSSLNMVPNLKEKMVPSIDDSRNLVENVKVSDRYHRLDDMKFYQEMIIDSNATMESNFDVDKDNYTNSLMATSYNMMNGDNIKIPKHMSSVVMMNKKELLSQMDRHLDVEKTTRIDYLSEKRNSMKKLFKFPFVNIMSNELEMKFSTSSIDLFGAERFTDDGTYYYRKAFGWKEQKERENEEKKLNYNINGIGIDVKQDTNMINDLIFELSEEMDIKKNSSMDVFKFLDKEKSMKNLRSSKLWMLMSFVSDLYLNISYLVGRREIFTYKTFKNGTYVPKSKSYTVMKRFGEYLLMVKQGSALTADKAVRYKVITSKTNISTGMSFNNFFHSFYDIEEDKEMVSTKWLSCTITDIRHFIKMREVTVSLISNFRDKAMEDEKASFNGFNIMRTRIITTMLILLEKSRGTSTCTQLNRYLLNSAFSYMSNREELIDDIFSEPTRSVLTSYMKIKQVEWYKNMLNKMEELWYTRIRTLKSLSNDYDRVHIPSFFDLEDTIEFSTAMDEIYVCNLFDKDSGFKDHRFKGIVEKMTKAELKYRSICKMPRSQGIINEVRDHLLAKDELHTFDKNFVKTATRLFFKQKSNKVKIKESLLKSAHETIDSAMMMTSSLVGGNYRSKVLEYNTKVKKTKSFLSIFDELKEIPTHMLFEICNNMDKLEAIFAIFPKPQIGGHREILIQSIMIRLAVKTLETLSKDLSKTHEKEMLTKQHMRVVHQSDTLSHYKDMTRSFAEKNTPAMYFSINIDSSKWAPGFVMEHFMYFINEWEVPNDIKKFMMSVISAFSQKKIMVPDDMMAKWKSKDINEKEFLEGIQKFKEWAIENEGVVTIFSGMGQGMLHYLSSFYHCVMDDYSDYMIKRFLKSKYNVTLMERTLISSDDKTKMCMLAFHKGLTNYERVLKEMMLLLDYYSRLANIHINYKKTGLNFIMTEFNSIFSIGKRMCYATIKDLYNCNNLPDLTMPEQAVREMLSNVRRCMEHGVYKTTLINIMMMCREQLLRWYRVSEADTTRMKMLFNCEENQLPFQLGYFPIDNVFPNLIYGPEVNMYSTVSQNNKKLMKFYRNLYTARSGLSKAKNEIPFSEENVGRYYVMLPTRIDSKLREMKEEFYKEHLNDSAENVKMMMNKNTNLVNMPKASLEHYNNFTASYFSGMNSTFEFQDTVVVHSLVRALQMSNKTAVMMPKSEEFVKAEDNYNMISNKRKNMLEKAEKTEDIDKEFLAAKELLDEMKVDIYLFSSKILNLDTKNIRSGFDLMYPVDEVMSVYEEMVLKKEKMTKSYNYFHPKFRDIRFGKEDISVSATYKELINYMMDEESDVKNSVITVLNMLLKKPKISNIFVDNDYNINTVFDNPFLFIEKYMNHSKTAFLDFKNYCEYTFKNLKNVEISMISPFTCGGNAYENLKRMEMFMSNPMFSLMDNETMNTKAEDYEKDFYTSITLQRGFKTHLTDEEKFTINNSDSKVLRSMKMSMTSRSKNVDSKLYNYKRVEYTSYYDNKEKFMVHNWTNLNTLVKIQETAKKSYIYIYSSKEIRNSDESDIIFSPVMKHLRDSENSGKELIMMNKRHRNEVYNMTYDITPINITTYVKDKSTKWTMYMDVSAEVSNFFKMTKTANTRFALITSSFAANAVDLLSLDIETMFDNEDGTAEITTLKQFMMEKPSILELDSVILKNNLVKKIEITSKNITDKDVYQEINEINAEFSKLDVSSMIKSLFNSQSVTASVDRIDEMIKTAESDTESNNSISWIETEDYKKDKENMLMSLEGKNFDSIVDSSTMMKMMDALLDKNMDYTKEDYNLELSDLTTVTNLVQKMVEESMEATMDINTQNMRRMYKTIKDSTGSEEAFHTMLIWQIKDIFDYKISDNMVLYLYNNILSKKMPMTDIKPINSFKIFGEEMRKTVNERVRFLTLKEPTKEEFDAITGFIS